MLFATWLPARDAAALSLVRLVNEVTGTADERQYIILVALLLKPFYTGMQGRIKVRGGPRLDTAMGPYPSFISYHRLCTLIVWGIVPGKM